MAAPRSRWFDPNLDPELLRSAEEAASSFSPYKVELRSGFRKGDPRLHGKGKALDVQLYDPKTGQALDAYQAGGAISPYQQFANYWYGRLNPELQKKARWGGYFGDPSDPGYGSKYGTQDYMHIDFGRSPGTGMLAGDWGTGFNEAAMKKLGLDKPGGIEALAAATGYSPEQIKSAFLSTVAGTESPGYNILYGGESFDDYSKHPSRDMPIFDPKHPGQVIGHSSAAGRYQFLKGTWEEQAKKYGYKDFSPETQDLAAWNYANDIFKQNTGGDLMEALNSGDPARINAAAQVLNKTWTSLPGGAEQAKGYGNKSFFDAYRGYLGGAGGGAAGSEDVTAPGGGGGGGGAAAATPEKSKRPTWDETLEALGEGVAGLGGSDYKPPSLPNQPGAAIAQAQVPQADPQQAEARRQQLAMMMQRLNQGALF